MDLDKLVMQDTYGVHKGGLLCKAVLVPWEGIALAPQLTGFTVRHLGSIRWLIK